MFARKFWTIVAGIFLVKSYGVLGNPDNPLHNEHPLFDSNLHSRREMFKMWNFVNAYFDKSRFLIVVHDSKKTSVDTDIFLRDLYVNTHKPILLLKDFNDNNNNVKEIDHLSATFGTKMGIIYVFETFESVIETIQTNNQYLKNALGNYLIMINDSDVSESDVTVDFVKSLYRYRVILNLIIIFPNTNFVDKVVMYDILARNFNFLENKKRWGFIRWTNESNAILIDKKVNNLNRFPIRCSLFERIPTVIVYKEIPTIFARSNYVKQLLSDSKGYGGLDGMILGALSAALNFNAIVLPPTAGIDYGYKQANGTYVGSLGDVINRVSDISINGRFIQQYNADEIEFLHPVFFDKFCIIAPKALEIPQWLAIFLCFDLQVWIVIVGITIFCGFFWYLLKKWAVRKRIKYQIQYGANEKISRDSYKYIVVSIEMWLLMLGGPAQLPYRTVERLFICTCLLANLIISGTFQGTLTTAFSTTSFYKDINTLKDLDNSGLRIGTSSRSIIDIFGDGGTPVLESLKRKFHLSKIPIIPQTATTRDVCSIERRADISVIIKTKYELPNGKVLLHVIEECPRVYYLAYIVRKGWPFAPYFNDILSRFFEAGLINKWYSDTENAIIDHKRFSSVNGITEDNQAFSLIDMQIAFYIIGGGLSFCTVVFILEICYFYLFDKNKTLILFTN